MALTVAQKQQARQWMATKFNPSWTKPAVNDALDAIDTHMATQTSAISTAINGASTPHGVTFNATQKKILFALWAEAKFNVDKDG